MRFHRISINAAAGVVTLGAALATLVALAPSTAAAAPDFEAPFREFSAGVEAVAVAPGDFDGDGLVDALVSIDAPAIDLVFMRQNPDHTFTAVGSWGTPDMLSELAAGDFNGDGLLDVAGLSFSDSVRVFFGDGLGASGGFTSRAAPPGANAIARANLNGAVDGDDLVVSSYSWAQLQTYVGDSGAVTPVQAYATLANPAGIGIGDLDGDGFDDIATAHEVIGVSQLLGTDGTGHIATSLSLSFAPGYAGSAAVSDVSGDGHADVLVGATDGTGVAVYLYLSPASYTPPTYYGGAVGSMNFSLHCGDLDGDGDRDVVMGGTPTRALINSGIGTFTAPASALLPEGVHNSSELHVVDFDADGVLDLLAAGNYGATLLAARGNGDATFGTDLQVPAVAVERALLADVDGDGDDDFVAVDNSALALHALSRAGAAFGAPVSTPLASYSYGLAAGDFEPDGHPDVVTASPSTGSIELFANDGLGGFPASISLATGEYPVNVAVGDIDGDGLDDVVAVCGFGGESRPGGGALAAAPAGVEGFAVFLNQGGLSFSLPIFTPATGGCPTSVAVADLDGDGFGDLVAAMACLPEVQVFTGLGTGAFSAPLSLPVGDGPSSVAVRDLDGDTLPDIVVASSSGWIHTIANAGGGAFGAPAGVPTNVGANHLVVGDFDADGAPDVAVLSMANVVAVHAGLAGGLLGPASGFGAFSGAGGLLGNDFDADGDLDLLVTSWGWPSIQFLRNAHGGGSSAVGGGATFATGVLDLRHPAPNPASGGTRLEFRLGSAQRVSVDIFDVRGRLVRRLMDGRALGEGSHGLAWDLAADDGTDVASGVYFARVRAGEAAVTRKVFVTR